MYVGDIVGGMSESAGDDDGGKHLKLLVDCPMPLAHLTRTHYIIAQIGRSHLIE